MTRLLSKFLQVLLGFARDVTGPRLSREDVKRLVDKRGSPEGLDLSGYDLTGVDLSGLDLRGAVFGDEWEALEPNTSLLKGARLERCDLRGANFTHADLSAVSFFRSNLQDAVLGVTNCSETVFREANLQGTNLHGAHLINADFLEADLRDSDFHSAYIGDINLTGARIGDRLLFEDYGKYLSFLQRNRVADDVVARCLATRFLIAEQTYRALKKTFRSQGEYKQASWAYRKERRMEKLEALQRGKNAWQQNDWKGAIRHYAKVVGDQLVEWICDYGEGIGRVAGSLIALWLAFALVYGAVAGVWGPWQDTASGKIRYITRNPIDLLSFSLAAMTTIEPFGLGARPTLAMRFLAPLEALLGIFFAGLLGFVAGNRIRRS